jgi:anti-anti-sigma regulatory factor/anti-sigma regulatory factor (Ser/Thr protein kinase)
VVRVDGDKIVFEGHLRGEARGALVCIYQLVKNLDHKHIILDFSNVNYAEASVMLPVASYAAFYRAHQIDFSLVEPTDPATNRLFVNTNWAHLIDPYKFNLNVKRRSNNLPALQFQDGDAQHNVVNKALEILMETIKFQGRDQLKALEWAINEITDNVLNHSESPIGGFVQIQSFPTKNKVSFYVVDAGLGIPYTLRRASPDITSDSQALDKAIREGVTRSPKTNQGNGLYGTFKCCEVSHGALTIVSNRAILKYDSNGLKVITDNVPFRGSFIHATIDYSTNSLLEKAFVFKGKVHEPGNDYIDMHYQYDELEDKIVFYVLAEVEGFGSRDFGRRARLKIDNILIDQGNAILFDFSGIPLISSSFADEVFAKLFVELGPLEFMRRCSFRSVDPTVKRLIDKAIEQRVKA